ncbi:hypothetical protein AALO_G00107220 [Alosa alosa]|uniref:Uncharacterized protein n=1 Tax=Alosa alosa TaxID=278164 RepID=A0AAV6GRR4_9TELE|nr:hypothetical protein AALO_G00107220 [Alosa alosa]
MSLSDECLTASTQCYSKLTVDCGEDRHHHISSHHRVLPRHQAQFFYLSPRL